MELESRRNRRQNENGKRPDEQKPGEQKERKKKGKGDGDGEGKTPSRNRRIILNILLVVCVGVFVFSAYMLISDYMEKQKAVGEYDDLTAHMAPLPEEGMLYHNRKIDFEALLLRNRDTVGWLWNPGTVIDYPVVYSTDAFYYLEHTFSKANNKTGAIFVDAGSSPDFTDRNTTIHGHHMKNGTMFASLEKYKDKAYYEEHPVMYLYTPEGTDEVVIFSSYVAHMEDPYTQTAFPTEEEYQSFLDGLKKRSAYAIEVEVTAQDRIITLSTCTYNYGDARLVVHGVLKPIEVGEPGDE